MPDFPPQTITALHEAYRRGTWRPSQVVEHWLARRAEDRAAPVWISVADAARLRSRAAGLDEALAAVPERALAQPLFGALCAVKDNIDVAGLGTTAGCPAFAYVPTRSAPVVERIEAAGGIVVGKTNLDQFATGLVGTRSPYGEVPNALNPVLISGGSSSGSAVAVARGLVHFALGTDTAGSGRVPAGLNNIVGLKPTRALLSTEGVVPACRSIDCVSVFALTVADAMRVLAAASTRAIPLERAAMERSFRFAVPRADQREFHGDSRAQAMFERAVARLVAMGGTPVEIDFEPWSAVAAMLYEGPMVAERHAGIRRFFDAHCDAIDRTVRTIMMGANAYSATDAYQAAARLDAQRAKLAPLWASFDVLVVPTVPTTYTRAQVAAEPIETNRRLGTYTNFVNLLGLAALSVPVAIGDDGFAFGVTLIGPAASDLALADLGARLHAEARLPLGATGTPLPPQEAFALRADRVQLAVVGAHLAGLPLNHQLVDRGATLVRRTRTAPHYLLYALPGTRPPKPGLVRVAVGAGAPPRAGVASSSAGAAATVGHAIEVEVWSMPISGFGSFVAGIPSPLAIGTVELEDGSCVHGFLCEGAAVLQAEDISRFGGWRSYLGASVAA